MMRRILLHGLSVTFLLATSTVGDVGAAAAEDATLGDRPVHTSCEPVAEDRASVLVDAAVSKDHVVSDQGLFSVCGDGNCDLDENPCNCRVDCGFASFETRCSDRIDNDCDGLIDCADSNCCADPDCSSDPICAPTCQPRKAACDSDSDCCSGKCRRGKCRG